MSEAQARTFACAVTSAVVCLVMACGPAAVGRDAEVANVLSRADDLVLRTRPRLMQGKYERMASEPYLFYRGSLALFRHDWEVGGAASSAFNEGLAPVWGLGDPHPENFGVLVAGDGTGALEPNDFDAADRVPYLFDVRRLVTGLALGTQTGEPEVAQRAVAFAAAKAYAETMGQYAQGAPAVRFVGPGSTPIEVDLFRRSSRDLASRRELGALTTRLDGQRTFRLGPIDPADPTQTLEPVPAFLRDAVKALLRTRGWAVLDVVRELGSGVASWPRTRLLVLVGGVTGDGSDDIVLELKELSESPLAGWYRPVVPATDTPERVEHALRRAWARPDADPRWYTDTCLGLAVQVRTESEAHKVVRTARWLDDARTVDDIAAFARVEGALLARVHAQSDATTVAAIAARIGADPDAFSEEQASFAVRYAERVRGDFARFRAALERLGPTLGVTPQPSDALSREAASLLGEGP